MNNKMILVLAQGEEALVISGAEDRTALKTRLIDLGSYYRM